MTDCITEKKVAMSAADWHAAADEALGHAIGWLRQDGLQGRAGALVRAAELLRARDTLHGRGNMLDMSGGVDETTIEVFPAADE